MRPRPRRPSPGSRCPSRRRPTAPACSVTPCPPVAAAEPPPPPVVAPAPAPVAASRRHALPGPRPQIPPDQLQRPDRPGGDGAHPAQRLRHRPRRARLHAHRRARRRQDHHRPHHRPRAELHRPGRHRRPDRRSLRRLPGLRGDPRRPPSGRDGDGRRQPHRRRRRARDHRGGCATARSRRATRSSSSTRSTCCRATRSTRC